LLILAFLIPVSWLSYKQIGNPLAPLAYGQQLRKIADMEQLLIDSPQERQVTEAYARRVADLEHRLDDPEHALQMERRDLRNSLHALDSTRVDDAKAAALRHELATLPKDATAARERWSVLLAENRERAKPLAGMPRHTLAFGGDPAGSASQQAEFETSRLNFLALVFCLMVGTAGLPHLLTRFYTTPSVAETRTSVAWSLFFIGALYLSAPALAVLVKYEVMAHLVGQQFENLPHWVSQWARDSSLLSVVDINGDNTLQFAELKISADLVMLATPEIGGLPYVVSVLVAAGALAAALSTADGLLLTIGNALAHDVYFMGESSRAEAMRRVMWSKFALLVVALLAAYAAAQRPAGILYLVSASFSLAGAAFVPVMILGIFWRDTTRAGAVGGMLVGQGVTIYYMLANLPSVRSALGLLECGLWWGIQPISAGVFGVATSLIATVVLTLVSRPARIPDDAMGDANSLA
jgi:cation/acetate symporter